MFSYLILCTKGKVLVIDLLNFNICLFIYIYCTMVAIMSEMLANLWLHFLRCVRREVDTMSLYMLYVGVHNLLFHHHLDHYSLTSSLYVVKLFFSWSYHQTIVDFLKKKWNKHDAECHYFCIILLNSVWALKFFFRK